MNGQSKIPYKETQSRGIPAARYNKNQQIHPTAEDAADAVRIGYRTPELVTIAREERRAGKQIQRETGIPFFSTGGRGLEWAVDHTAPEVGKHSQTHGFSSKTFITNLDDIVTEGVDSQRTLYSMPFMRSGEFMEAFGADMPKKENGIYVVADYDRQLTGKNAVKYVVLGEEYMNVVDVMQQLWPSVQIVPWHDAPRVLTQQYNAVTGEALPYEEVTEENQPYYPKKRALFTPSPLPQPDIPTPHPQHTSSEDDIW